MLAKLASYTLVGIDATPVEVEVDVSYSSSPKTLPVCLAEAAVWESTRRVERAIVNSGYRRPIDRAVINSAPRIWLTSGGNVARNPVRAPPLRALPGGSRPPLLP